MSQRAVARRFRVSLSTVQRWVRRADDRRLDRVDFGAKPRGGPRLRTDRATEQLILALRRELREKSELGECGARAIHRTMQDRGDAAVPCVRTIGRILARGGVLDGKHRTRRKPPPRGWHLPVAADGLAEVDSFDVIEGLRIKDGPAVEVLTAISLFGGLVQSWPFEDRVRAVDVVQCLIAHWTAHGLPAYAHFDNGTIFQGAHQHADSIGRVTRLCLALGVIPVFAPPGEHGFQNCVESLNGRWQKSVWARFHHDSFKALCKCSARYIAAVHKATAARREAAPKRRTMPRNFRFDPDKALRGELIFIRRTDDKGRLSVLGHQWSPDTQWQGRLVRATVDLDEDTIDFHALRRKEPDHQPLLATRKYHFPRKPFKT